MRILFFFIWGGRTGSEVTLHNFICHADQKRIEIGVACGQKGELMKNLPPDVPCFDYSDPMLARNGTELSGVRQVFDQALNSFYHRSYHALHGGYPSLKQATNLEKIW